MRLIRSVEIEGFRSLVRIRLDDLSDFMALVGPNNSGKSNILRALNLFFNGETDPDQYLDFSVDSHLSRARQRKRIVITVEFDLPAEFKVNSPLEALARDLGRRFRVKKTWTLDAPYDPTIETSAGGRGFVTADGDRRQKVQRLLDLVSFRYVPNRAVPAKLIRNEWAAVQAELARRVGKKIDLPYSTFRTGAKGMIQPFADDIKGALRIGDLELATPTDLKDLVFSSIGLRVPVGRRVVIEDTSLGAGAQGVLMLCMLHLIDKARFRNFGWTQAAFWAIEEPESSLHRALQFKAAALLRTYSEEKRFQILITTHNEIFIDYARSGFMVTLDGEAGKTQASPCTVGDLASQAMSEEISGYTPPGLKGLGRCVVLLEGKTDCSILTRAAQLLDLGIGLSFCTPSQLDESLDGDGFDQIVGFLRGQRRNLSRRMPSCPMLVLIDWDKKGSIKKVTSAYGSGSERLIAVMKEEWCDEKCNGTLRGIERFLSPRILQVAMGRGVKGIDVTQGGVVTVVNPGEFERGKALLADTFAEEGTRQDCSSLRPALEWADAVRCARPA